MRLGDVGEREEPREGARDRLRITQRERAEHVRELLRRCAVASARTLRQRPHPLHRLEELHALVAADRVAEQRPQDAHVVAERRVGVVGGVRDRHDREDSGMRGVSAGARHV